MVNIFVIYLLSYLLIKYIDFFRPGTSGPDPAEEDAELASKLASNDALAEAAIRERDEVRLGLSC